MQQSAHLIPTIITTLWLFPVSINDFLNQEGQNSKSNMFHIVRGLIESTFCIFSCNNELLTRCILSLSPSSVFERSKLDMDFLFGLEEDLSGRRRHNLDEFMSLASYNEYGWLFSAHFQQFQNQLTSLFSLIPGFNSKIQQRVIHLIQCHFITPTTHLQSCHKHQRITQREQLAIWIYFS